MRWHNRRAHLLSCLYHRLAVDAYPPAARGALACSYPPCHGPTVGAYPISCAGAYAPTCATRTYPVLCATNRDNPTTPGV